MKIVIAGGSGFLGQKLSNFFAEKQDEVIILTRKPNKPNEVFWDGSTLGEWCSSLVGADVLINLTGKSVDCRYTEDNMREIISSRVNSTMILDEALSKCPNPPKIWMNASSATTYIHAQTIQMNEEDGIVGDDFSMQVCKVWEKTFFDGKFLGIRKVALRTSIVLGDEGGAFPKMKLMARVGLGGRLGDGDQYMSVVHAHDFCRAVQFIIDNEHLVGPINITNPTAIKNKEFMKELRRYVGFPFGIPIPKLLLEFGAILANTETELLLKSRNAIPTILLNAGFEFSKYDADDFFKYY